QRDNNVSDIKMPPLAKNMIDSNAVAAVAAWINTLPPLTNALPVPWDHSDIGNVGYAGDASYATGQFTVQASGDDIWNTADAGHIVYLSLNGDGEIKARVVSVQNTDGWAKAGVTFRESLAAGSTHASMFVTPGNGTAFQYRAATSGDSTHTAGP